MCRRNPRAKGEGMIGKDMTRTELLRIIDEFKSERDAAKADAMRCWDERNILLNELKELRASLLAIRISHDYR